VFLANTTFFFDIYTNASNLKWEVQSFGCLSKSRRGSNANPCPGPGDRSLNLAVDRIELYPNPTEGIIQIEAEIDRSQTVLIVVTDVFGKKVQEIAGLPLRSSVFNIDLSSHTDGIYFVNFIYGQQSRSWKVIKLATE
jgi:hypothetical protein